MVTSFILSRLDYCNSLPSGLLVYSVHIYISFYTYRTVLLTSCSKKKGKTDHIALLFQSLHWLPILQGIQYKINTFSYTCRPCCIMLRHTKLYVPGGQHGRGRQRGGLQACLPQRTAAGAGRGADPAAVRVGPRDGPQHHHADGPAHGQGLPSGHV